MFVCFLLLSGIVLALQGQGDGSAKLLILVLVFKKVSPVAVVNEQSVLCIISELRQPVQALDRDILKLLVLPLVFFLFPLVLKLQGVDVDGFVDLAPVLVFADDTEGPASFGTFVLDQDVLAAPITGDAVHPDGQVEARHAQLVHQALRQVVPLLDPLDLKPREGHTVREHDV